MSRSITVSQVHKICLREFWDVLPMIHSQLIDNVFTCIVNKEIKHWYMILAWPCYTLQKILINALENAIK